MKKTNFKLSRVRVVALVVALCTLIAATSCNKVTDETILPEESIFTSEEPSLGGGLSEDSVTDGDQSEELTGGNDQSESQSAGSQNTEQIQTDAESTEKSESTTAAPPVEIIEGILSYDHLNELSSNKNIIFFLIDRFDVRYFEKLQKSDPAFFEKLDGFTFYNDYTSLYCRTYPAIASILTGKENDFSDTRLNFFKKIYSDGGHLRDLYNAGYSVNVYTEEYYAYDNASVMSEYVQNVSGAAVYDADMKNVYDYITGNEFVKVESQGQFSFIHIYGCHTPIKYNLDWEEANDKEKNDTTMALKQSLTIIYEYIEEMKRLGVYDDATIIITGDHPAALSDTKLIGETGRSDDNGTRVTAMLFKKSGDSGTALKTSTAQISQDELWNTIYESEGLMHLKNGDSFFDIKEGEERVRRYLFELSVTLEDKSRADEIVEYRITGSARNKDNWEVYKRTVIGRIYK